MNTELEREDEGRWIGEVTEMPGVLVYGETEAEAIAKALALRVIADRLEHGEICSGRTQDRFLCHPELDSGSQTPSLWILNQVQDDKIGRFA